MHIPIDTEISRKTVQMARSARFELTTFASGGRHSIQLSYERNGVMLHRKIAFVKRFRQVCAKRLI